MFEANLKPARVLKLILEAIKELVDDAVFECSEAGVALQSMDSAHVALVQLLLECDGFASYRCDRPVRLGIHLASLYKIIKCAGNEDTVMLRAKDDPDTLDIKIDGSERCCEFQLKLLDIEADLLGIPDMDVETEISMPARSFQKVCADLVKFGDTVAIETKKGERRVAFHTAGDMGPAKILYQESGAVEDWNLTTVKVDKATKLSFALRYLSLFAKATALSNYTTIQLNSECPMSIDYPIEQPLANPEKAVYYGYVRYYLAPKIDDSD